MDGTSGVIPADFSWTDENTAKLIEMWADPQNSSGRIGWALGCSKNAVISKAHRLDLPSRPSPLNLGSKRPPVDRDKQAKQPTPNRRTIMRAPPPKKKVVPYALGATEVARMRKEALPARKPVFRAPPPLKTYSIGRIPVVIECQFPFDNPKDVWPKFRMCKKPSYPDMPYCEEHCRVCYTRWGDHKPAMEATNG